MTININNSPMTPQEVREIREALGLTQTQLGEIFGKSLPQAQKWEATTKTHSPPPTGTAIALRLMYDLIGTKQGKQYGL